MNKDEMIKDMAKVLCGMECKYCENCFHLKQATALYNAGYRKVADDEVVFKQSEVDEFRKDQAEVKFLKNKIKQETAREILQKLKDNIMLADFGCGDGYEEVVDMNTDELKKLAKEKGIELED